jgi:hypothetical protein
MITGNIHDTEVQQHAAEKIFARIISYVFHPLFVPLYVTCFALYVHPLLFAGYDDGRKIRMLATVIVNLGFFPALTVFLCWRLGFIRNMYLNTMKERIIPLAAAMIFYFWCWFVLRNFVEIPMVYRQFLLGSFITIIAAWLANISFKVSLHALAMGGMLFFIGLLSYGVEAGSAWYLAVALLIAGVVCSSRLVLRTHTPFEVYAGLVLGVLSQVVAVVVT